MKIVLNVIVLLAGFVLLIKGADIFVDGSAALAKKLKISGTIIGLTIVAFGTSAPELAVSTSAAIQGSNEIALSNVVGSNIFNLLCVLGICSIISAVPVDKGIIKRDFPFSVIVTFFVFVLSFFDVLFCGKGLSNNMKENVGEYSRFSGVFAIVVFVLYIVFLILAAKKNQEEKSEEEHKSIWKCIFEILIGLIMIVIGGKTVVNSAKYIAQAAGMTETLIGLTIVAVGTSLPELVTSVVAAKKGETGLAVGNAVGSNIFNILLILGVSAVICPIRVNVASFYDMIILLIISIITYIFAITKRSINKKEGVIMVLLYFADVVFAVIR